ncbi:hypothetical protein BCAR13_120063 [Paraburkholderia caribensis]|nr:hypothetical protein BCAR13_120063 [Paraburkholderia caribensis]
MTATAQPSARRSCRLALAGREGSPAGSEGGKAEFGELMAMMAKMIRKRRRASTLPRWLDPLRVIWRPAAMAPLSGHM